MQRIQPINGPRCEQPLDGFGGTVIMTAAGTTAETSFDGVLSSPSRTAVAW